MPQLLSPPMRIGLLLSLGWLSSFFASDLHAQVRFDRSLRDGRVTGAAVDTLGFDGTALYAGSVVSGHFVPGGMSVPTTYVVSRVDAGRALVRESESTEPWSELVCTAAVCARLDPTRTFVTMHARPSGALLGTVTFALGGGSGILGLERSGDAIVAYSVAENSVRLYELPMEDGVVDAAVSVTVPPLSFLDFACEPTGTRCVVAFAQEGGVVGWVPLDALVPGSMVTAGSHPSGSLVGSMRAGAGGGRVVLAVYGVTDDFVPEVELRIWRGASTGGALAAARTGLGSGAGSSLVGVACDAAGHGFVAMAESDAFHVPPTGEVAALPGDGPTVLACSVDVCWTNANAYEVVAGTARTRGTFGHPLRQSTPALGVREGSAIVSFQDEDVFFATVDAAGNLGTLHPLLWRDLGVTSVSLVPYSDGYYALQGNLVRRLSADGARRGDLVASLSSAHGAGVVTSTNHLLALTTGERVMSRRVTPLGNAEGDAETLVRDAIPANRGEPYDHVSVARGGDTILAVWTEWRDGLKDVYGTRLDEQGRPLGAPFTISVAEGHQEVPEIVWLGDVFLVAWRDNLASVRGARVSVDGEVLDPTGFELAPAEHSTDGAQRGFRVIVDGAELGIARAVNELRTLADGSNYYASVLRVARVTRSGILRDDVAVREGGVSLVPSVFGGTVVVPHSFRGLDLVRVSSGDWLLAYAEYRSEADQEVRLVGLDWSGISGGSCEGAADCASGFCVAGVCCEAACDGECSTCRAAEGAPADGVCAPRAAGTECRASGGACDRAEACDGSSLTCPPDEADECVDGGSSEVPDAGSVDAGVGAGDAGVALDAGSGSSGGGGCSTTSGSATWPALLWLAARRRRGRRAPR